MAVKKFKPYTPSRRFMTVADFSEITKTEPEKSLVKPLKKTGAEQPGADHGALPRRRPQALVPHH